MINQLHKIAEERGGRCLSDTCRNAHTIIWWECENGHRWQASPIRVKSAVNWCPVCAGRTARKTIEDMQALAEERGGKCLSEIYKDARIKLLWECAKGHQWEAVPGNIKQGTWCPYCAQKVKRTIEEMRQIAKDRGGRCLSDTYKNAHTKLQWECSVGHRWETSPTNVRLYGRWCPTCAGRTARRTIQDMQALAAERGGKCLSETYNDSRAKLSWECSKGHQWEATHGSVKNGSWCPNCAGNVKHTIEEMRDIAAERGGRCLSETYKNGMTKLVWECSEGHQWEAMPMKIIKGTWCRKCHNAKRSNRSQKEQVI